MREIFVNKTFRAATLETIEKANAIIAEYEEKGFTLTLRQLYYQFVARDLIANKQSEYKRLGSIINDARLAGMIDWAAIEDRTRYLRQIPTYAGPGDRIASATRSYAEDLWADQEFYCEVWIEKDALVGVIERVCNQWRVPFFPCRGYNSQSEQYEAGQRLWRAHNERHKRIKIFHLGDHDPSGIDMTKDNQERLTMFANTFVRVKRLALNYDQVELYNPPPNPAKETDSRFEGYRDAFGEHCWELDALNPEVIEALIDQNIRSIVDYPKFQRALKKEQNNETLLQKAADNWDAVQAFLRTVE